MFNPAKFALCLCILASFFQIYTAANLDFRRAHQRKGRSHFPKPPAVPSVKKRDGVCHTRNPIPSPSMQPPSSQPNILDIMEANSPGDFCSSYLQISPSTTTITETSSIGELATVETVVTTTLDLGTTTIPTSLTTTVTATETDFTVTNTETDTSTVTSTSSVTTTTTVFGNSPQRRTITTTPTWLPSSFSPSEISSACSHFVTPGSNVATVTTTTTLDIGTTASETSTSTTTSTIPQSTETSTLTITNTDTFSATETDSTTTITTTTTTTTVTAVATQHPCDSPFLSLGNLLPNDPNQLNPFGHGTPLNWGGTGHNTVADPAQCCQICWSTLGCGYWIVYQGSGCLVVYSRAAGQANSPPPTDQCPLGEIPWNAYLTSHSPPNGIGAPGPCGHNVTNIGP